MPFIATHCWGHNSTENTELSHRGIDLHTAWTCMKAMLYVSVSKIQEYNLIIFFHARPKHSSLHHFVSESSDQRVYMADQQHASWKKQCIKNSDCSFVPCGYLSWFSVERKRKWESFDNGRGQTSNEECVFCRESWRWTLSMETYNRALVLWLSKDKQVVNAEKLVCQPLCSDRNFIIVTPPHKQMHYMTGFIYDTTRYLAGVIFWSPVMNWWLDRDMDKQLERMDGCICELSARILEHFTHSKRGVEYWFASDLDLLSAISRSGMSKH